MYTVHDQLYVSINMEDVLVLIDPHCIGWSMNEYVQLVYVEILAYWSGLQCFRGAIITVQLQILISHFLFSLSRRLCSCHWNFRILVTDMVWELFKRWEDPKTTKLRHSPLICWSNATSLSTTPKKNLCGRYWISSTNLHLVNMFQLWSYPTPVGDGPILQNQHFVWDFHVER